MSTTPPPPPPPPSPPPGDEFGGQQGRSFGPRSTGADRVDVPVPSAPEPFGPAGRTLPPAWKRIIARLLDGFIVYFVLGSVISLMILGDDFRGGPADADINTGASVLAGLAVVGLGFFWEAVMTKVTGGTPMKRAFKMRVVNVGTGSEITWFTSITRWGVFAVLSLVPIIGPLGQFAMIITSLVFLFTKPLRRAVWDLAAKTVVVDG